MPGKNICPGCGRHCDLNEPRCGRGKEYRRTGKMPERHEEMFSCLSEEEKRELLPLLERVCADWRIRYRGNGKLHGHGGN